MSQPTLPAAPRAHDLPPRWDGSTVEWGGWQVEDTTLRYHVKARCCRFCGSLEWPVANIGMVRTDAPRGVMSIRKRYGYQLGRLYAFRCPDCKRDQVVDLAGVLWDLDDTDYGDEGSWS